MYKSNDIMVEYCCGSTKSLWMKKKNAIKVLFKVVKPKVTGYYHNNQSEKYHMQMDLCQSEK